MTDEHDSTQLKHALGSRQETAGPAFQHPHQNRIHEFVVVWNVEADDPFALQAGTEFPVQLGAVGLLHDEDDVSPLDLLGRQRHARAVGNAGRVGLDPRQVEKICSAVGLRRRLALQTNKTLVMIYRG